MARCTQEPARLASKPHRVRARPPLLGQRVPDGLVLLGTCGERQLGPALYAGDGEERRHVQLYLAQVVVPAAHLRASKKYIALESPLEWRSR